MLTNTQIANRMKLVEFLFDTSIPKAKYQLGNGWGGYCCLGKGCLIIDPKSADNMYSEENTFPGDVLNYPVPTFGYFYGIPISDDNVSRSDLPKAPLTQVTLSLLNDGSDDFEEYTHEEIGMILHLDTLMLMEEESE